jgi:hypothetical protein
MSNHTRRTDRLTAVAAYLEAEFSGHVTATKGNTFRISHEGIQVRYALAGCVHGDDHLAASCEITKSHKRTTEDLSHETLRLSWA